MDKTVTVLGKLIAMCGLAITTNDTSLDANGLLKVLTDLLPEERASMEKMYLHGYSHCQRNLPDEEVTTFDKTFTQTP